MPDDIPVLVSVSALAGEMRVSVYRDKWATVEFARGFNISGSVKPVRELLARALELLDREIDAKGLSR